MVKVMRFRFFYDLRHFILKSVGLIFTYLATAKISLMFATVTGNATLLWIPGGIALGVVLIGGLRYLPSVFTGTLLSAIIVNDPLSLGLGISIGNTLETYIAYTLLNRYGHFNRALTSTKDLYVLIVLGGLVAPPSPALH